MLIILERTPMKKTLPWIILVMIIVAAVGGYFLWQHSTGPQIPAYVPPASEPPGKGAVGNAKLNPDSYDVVVTYTDNGFSPRDTTIKQGQRVRFLNNSSGAFWPASGIHPTHSLYPEKESTDCLGSSFDACQYVQKGEYFDFTFYYPGTWNFHDHIHAYNTGDIIVEASSTAQQ